MKDEIQKQKELQELIEQCISKKRKAQYKFYKRFYSSLFAVCVRFAKNNEEAEDMLNEGFLKIFDNLDKYQATGSFEAWLKRVVVNTAIDYQRKYKTTEHNVVEYDLLPDTQMPVEDNNALSKMSSDELLQLIQELPPISKQVFNLYVFEDYSHAEIAALLNIKEGTSHWHLNFARTKLKEKINSLN
ncbi:MAG TPA: RNA polymerase sigma factor [Bacteroidales bacterium]|jgi:RNA polymerase sigma-70 factor (ECF subfamily)|nr:RNA polymerase sigma factor [Bacteroidales bacterium]HRR04015.1 RNA polymerase sigma factor [Bacteroidales bacterium]HRT14220.1 RNA polymerase sigma factor [Bacteroidales bacterium]